MLYLYNNTLSEKQNKIKSFSHFVDKTDFCQILTLFGTIFSIAGSGSDAASLLTSAQRKGDHYILNGSKVTMRLLTLTIGW